jgi:hypothetical protein
MGEQQESAAVAVGRQLAERSSGSGDTRQHSGKSSATTTRQKSLAPALARLCSAKSAMELTPHAVHTWTAALTTYRSEIVNYCIVQAAISADPFPDLGKLIAACEEETQRRFPDDNKRNGKPGKRRIEAVAKAWGIEL